jgi:hypothetical protein
MKDYTLLCTNGMPMQKEHTKDYINDNGGKSNSKLFGMHAERITDLFKYRGASSGASIYQNYNNVIVSSNVVAGKEPEYLLKNMLLIGITSPVSEFDDMSVDYEEGTPDIKYIKKENLPANLKNKKSMFDVQHGLLFPQKIGNAHWRLDKFGTLLWTWGDRAQLQITKMELEENGYKVNRVLDMFETVNSKNWYATYKIAQENPIQEVPAQEILTDAKITEIADYCINYVWRQYAYDFKQDPSSKYSDYNIRLMVDNEEPLNTLIWKYGEENKYKIEKRITQRLEELENKAFQKKKKKTPENPLDSIRQAIKGKSWAKAKLALVRLTPGGATISTDWNVSDESAEENFQRLYNVMFSGTYVDLDYIKQTSPFKDNDRKPILKRLNEIQDHNVNSVNMSDHEQHNEYLETQIFNSLFGYKEKTVPETIKVYRGVSNPHATIRPGDYVTPSRDYARDYIRGKAGVILQDTIPTKDLIINKIPYDYSEVELVYYPVSFQKEVEEKGQESFVKKPPFTLKELFNDVNGTAL